MRLRSSILTCLALVVASVAAFWSLHDHGFVDYDDGAYLTENEQVRGGLTASGIAWAFTTGANANWHPLTWLSHMLDVELFGIERPGLHHVVSLLLHITSSVLLLIVLLRMTGALWRSAFVAAAFALHPVHVESVAWAAERKDVLSTLFWIASIGLYVDYTRRGGPGRYGLALLALALGLMSKPMLVTAPFLLMLLDYWPLQRLELTRASLARSFVEKLPMLALVVASSIVTYLVQEGGGAVIVEAPLGQRLAATATSYVRYLDKTLWPTDLAVLYPVRAWPLWQALGAAGLLAAITIAVVRWRRTRYLPVGWFWYLGTLVPVIGIVRIGELSIADRYMYFPMTGLAIVVAWGVADLRRRWAIGAAPIAVAAGVVVLAMFLRTRDQVAVWRDGVTLFRHSADAVGGSGLLHRYLGVSLTKAQRYDEAGAEYRRALELSPDLAQAHSEYGFLLLLRGSLDDARTHLEKGTVLGPTDPNAFHNLGLVQHRQNDYGGAVASLRHALELDPRHPLARDNLALALASMAQACANSGRTDEAVAHLREALSVRVDAPETLTHLAWVLAAYPSASLRDAGQAVSLAERAARLTHAQDGPVLDALAAAYANAGRFDDAVRTAERALDIATRLRANIADEIRARLELYRQRSAYRRPDETPR